jgi:hypothetical protein
MADKESLSREVLRPIRLRPRLYFVACVVAALLGGGLAMAEMAEMAEMADETAHSPQRHSPEPSACHAMCTEHSSARHLKNNECTLNSIHSTVAGWLVEEWTAPGADSLLASARIVPALEEGKMVGLTIYGLRPHSPLAVLGVANGDTIYSIDEQELSSIDRTMEVYNELALGQPGEFALALRRNGCPLSIHLRVL